MQFTDGSTKRGVGVRLFVAAVVLASLFTVGTFAERKPDFDAFFGVEAYRELPLAAFGIALFLLFSLLLIPGLSNRLAESSAESVRQFLDPCASLSCSYWPHSPFGF